MDSRVRESSRLVGQHGFTRAVTSSLPRRLTFHQLRCTHLELSQLRSSQFGDFEVLPLSGFEPTISEFVVQCANH